VEDKPGFELQSLNAWHYQILNKQANRLQFDDHAIETVKVLAFWSPKQVLDFSNHSC